MKNIPGWQWMAGIIGFINLKLPSIHKLGSMVELIASDTLTLECNPIFSLLICSNVDDQMYPYGNGRLAEIVIPKIAF